MLKACDVGNFVSLHNHSDYSLFDAVSKYSDLIARAKELGMSALGITEHGTTSGLLDFYLKCSNAGIKPILGCEFYISTDINVNSRDNTYHLCLWAKDYDGYVNLNRLNSYSQQHIYYKPRICFSKLKEFSKGLVCSSACLGGLLNSDSADEYCLLLQDIFGDDFYVEFQFNTIREQAPYNEKLAYLARKYSIPCICTIDSHYVYKEDAEVHRLWKGIRDKETVFSGDDFYLYDGIEMFKRATRQFPPSFVRSMIDNTFEIAEKCTCIIDKCELNYPMFRADNQKRLLNKLVADGVKDRLAGNGLNEEYRQRALLELNAIEKASYINYFLIIHDLCEWADNISGIRRGVGRGSVTASLISYFLGITAIDPIEQNLLFERFLHLERVTPPDIDLDFQSSRRDEVIDYLREKYGFAYQVRTFNLMDYPAAIQRAGQALGLVPSDVLRISKGCTSFDELPKSCPVANIMNDDYTKLIWLAKKFYGLIQNFGKHASAIMVFPKEVENYCAIEVQDGTPVVNFDFHLCEGHFGLLKLDILGLKTLDVIDGCISILKSQGRELPYDINKIPEKDDLTTKMLEKGLTCGCFQLESGGMMNLVTQLQPQSYSELIPLIALYRPGTLKAGMTDQFVARKRGEQCTTYLNPALEPIMKDTYGVCLYQEQVMQMVQVMANYSLGQADLFRRAIGRKDLALMNEILPPFITACEKNGFTHEQAQEVADYIYGCSDYLFNKGHSAGYGFVSYQTVYLKANYPLEYMCSLLNVYIKDKEQQTVYMEHCRKIGIKIVSPSIEFSEDLWTVKNNALYVGLSGLKHVGNAIFNRSETSFDGFMKNNIDVNRRCLQSLIKAGCFSGNRYELLEKLDWYKDDRHGYKKYLECLEKIEFYKDKPKRVAIWEEKRDSVPMFVPKATYPENYADMELEVMDFTFYDVLNDYDLSACDYYSDLIGGVVEKIKPWQTAKGKPMAFVKVRTNYGISELVVFNESYQNMKEGGVFLFKVNQTRPTIINEFEIAKLIS